MKRRTVIGVAVGLAAILLLGCDPGEIGGGANPTVQSVPTKADPGRLGFFRDISSSQHQDLIRGLLANNRDHQALVARMRERFSFSLEDADFVAFGDTEGQSLIGISYRDPTGGPKHALIVSLYSAQAPFEPKYDYIEEYHADSGNVFIHYVGSSGVQRVLAEVLQ